MRLRTLKFFFFVVVSLVVFQRLREYDHVRTQDPLNWKEASIEGFRFGVTLEEIVAVRGPANSHDKGSWMWNSPDLTLTQVDKSIRLTGYQLECGGRIFHCGNRFAFLQMHQSLATMANQKYRPAETSPKGQSDTRLTVQKAFGPGRITGEDDGNPVLIYNDSSSKDLALAFIIDNHNDFELGSGRIFCVELTWTVD